MPSYPVKMSPAESEDVRKQAAASGYTSVSSYIRHLLGLQIKQGGRPTKLTYVAEIEAAFIASKKQFEVNITRSSAPKARALCRALAAQNGLVAVMRNDFDNYKLEVMLVCPPSTPQGA